MPTNEDEEEVEIINGMPTVRNKEIGINKIRNNIRIADSGASSQIINKTCGLIKSRKINSKVKIGSREYVDYLGYYIVPLGVSDIHIFPKKALEYKVYLRTGII